MGEGEVIKESIILLIFCGRIQQKTKPIDRRIKKEKKNTETNKIWGILGL